MGKVEHNQTIKLTEPERKEKAEVSLEYLTPDLATIFKHNPENIEKYMEIIYFI